MPESVRGYSAFELLLAEVVDLNQELDLWSVQEELLGWKG